MLKRNLELRSNLNTKQHHVKMLMHVWLPLVAFKWKDTAVCSSWPACLFRAEHLPTWLSSVEVTAFPKLSVPRAVVSPGGPGSAVQQGSFLLMCQLGNYAVEVLTQWRDLTSCSLAGISSHWIMVLCASTNKEVDLKSYQLMFPRGPMPRSLRWEKVLS